MIYLYFYENIFQDNFIHIYMIFTFSNSITLKLLMICNKEYVNIDALSHYEKTSGS
jgi:hypothetical protein